MLAYHKMKKGTKQGFPAGLRVVARNHRLADTVKGGELSYTTLAMEREHIACSSLLRLAGAVLADPEPMPPRLIRGCCIALAFTCLRNGTQPHRSLADCMSMIQYRHC